MRSSRGRRGLQVTLVIVLAVQTYLLYTPAPPNPPAGVTGADLVAHVLLFGVPTMLALLLRPRRWVPAALVGYAVVSELLQRLIPHRSSDVADAVADVVGVAVGVAAAWAVRRRSGSQPTHSVR